MGTYAETAKTVLDYWYTLEFLTQDVFPDYRKTVKDARGETAASIFKKNSSLKQEKKAVQKKIIEDYLVFTGNAAGTDLSAEFQKRAEAYGTDRKTGNPKYTWGGITVYVGKVKRERCIDTIARYLPFDADEKGPEKSFDTIAMATVNLTENGELVPGSLTVSPILEAMRKLRGTKSGIAGILNEEEYRKTNQELEDRVFKKEEDEEAPANTIGAEGRQGFSAQAVTMAQIAELYQILCREYLAKTADPAEKNTLSEIYACHTHFFRTNAPKPVSASEKAAYEEENADMGLSQSFFASDLRMARELAYQGKLGTHTEEYIAAPYVKEDVRYDVIKPQGIERDNYPSLARKIMRPENAPLGKWPSKFMPAFMQQMAINLQIRTGKSELFSVNGDIFSVNGPPGTGKTTLLKEIIVHNIVARAILLAEYSDPDDAFEARSFLHGEKKDNAYSTFTRNWHVLKNDRINDYGILVTSCNNAAVENISKELPQSVQKDLEPEKSASPELNRGLEEVAKLFDPKQNGTEEHRKEFVTVTDAESGAPKSEKRDVTFRDLYFTEYADGLLGTKDAWGLMSAALGKRSNIQSFYYKVLDPVLKDFYGSNNMIASRKSRYDQARQVFQKQLAVVRNMQEQLSKTALSVERSERIRETADEIRRRKSEAQQAAGNAELAAKPRINEKREAIRRAEEARQQLTGRETALQERLRSLNITIEALGAEIKSLRSQAGEARGGVGLLAKLFGGRQRSEAEEKAAALDAQASERTEQLKQLNEEAHQMQESLDAVRGTIRETDRVIAEAHEEIRRIEESVTAAKNTAAAAAQEEARLLGELADAQKQAAAARSLPDTRKAVSLDDAFTERLLSDDVKVSTKAHVANPWFTQEYNREREKLFLYAMLLHKEFVLSSKACRNNFITLSQYWGFRKGDDDEQIRFHSEDKERMVPALLQTLFLMVPVISTTFASVGMFLKDVRKPDVIGTLVVDEAGQAQPHMAVGALYRSRRAVIVGDPKQVEPVVTDDLQLFKKAYSDPALIPYKDKTISVQSFADQLNAFGTYLLDDSGASQWVGCPLVVHRRCISPMFDISNAISYNGIMKIQTGMPKAEKAAKFIQAQSEWIDVEGKEIGGGNHFVAAQGEEVLRLLDEAFRKSAEPSIFIISPFTTVVSEIRKMIQARYKGDAKADYMLSADHKRIGTVHTFQGKEADEVIFLLGCDDTAGSSGAIRWVNRNIVNVAATRAKFRLYIIGGRDAWRKSACVSQAGDIMEQFAQASAAAASPAP